MSITFDNSDKGIVIMISRRNQPYPTEQLYLTIYTRLDNKLTKINFSENSPIGYNTYDEIVVTRQINIGGKNKYLINGVMVQNNKVADFFQSVGLNINNPHFLIMQGRVTKGPGFIISTVILFEIHPK